ncbi:MAG: hypothetical protein R3E82_11325 [Pseudomonadales bacterium]
MKGGLNSADLIIRAIPLADINDGFELMQSRESIRARVGYG